MLYKYYRYVLIVKILFLLIGGWLFYRQTTQPQTPAGGTVFLVSAGVQFSGDFSLLQSQDAPLPRAVVAQQPGKIILHIPWTEDRQYVQQYITNPIPTVDITKATTAGGYLLGCEKLIKLIGPTPDISTCDGYNPISSLDIPYQKEISYILLILGAIL